MGIGLLGRVDTREWIGTEASASLARKISSATVISPNIMTFVPEALSQRSIVMFSFEFSALLLEDV